MRVPSLSHTLRAGILASGLLAALAAPPPYAVTFWRAAHATARSAPTIRLQPCRLPGDVQALCGAILVYENRADRRGRMIDLRVAVIRATGPRPAPDPIVFLSGGPGGAATQDYARMAQALPELLRRHDFVLVDQRGTGGSHPLACPLPASIDLSDPKAATVQVPAWARGCFGHMDGDPRYYTTPLAMDDLDDIRAALGYERIDLWGESYGATAAQYYMLQHPDHVRTATLGGASLLGVRLLDTWPQGQQMAMVKLFGTCAADTACHAAYPDLRREFELLLARVRRAPVPTTVTDPATGRSLAITPYALYQVVHAMLLATASSRTLPGLIHRAQAHGDFTAMAQAYLATLAARRTTAATVMYWSVVCNSPWAEPAVVAVARRAAATYFPDAPVEDARLQQAVCRSIPANPDSGTFSRPLRSQAPVLLLSGDADPQDPPANGAVHRADLPNARQVILPGESHIPADNACRYRIFTAFVERGSADGVDTSCTRHLQVPAFSIQP